MRALCVTVDFDRDVNRAVPGRRGAVSSEDMTCRTVSTMEGSILLSEMFDDLGIRATFFAEAATLQLVGASSLSGHEVGLHGYDHEDFSGHVSGLPMTVPEIEDVMERSVSAVKDAVGTAPKGFRAPYMRTHGPLMAMLKDYGIEYDSSEYSDLGRVMLPYRKWGITEIPVPKGRDASGRAVAAYLWPMHEGSRSPEDYADMGSEMEEGVFVIATHAWHMTESRKGGIMGPEELERNLSNVRKVIESFLDAGYGSMTMLKAAVSFPSLR